MKSALRILVGIVTLATLTEAHAMRWYSPSTGRWFSRDPLGDEVFFRFYSADKSVNKLRQLHYESIRPIFVFVGNNSINFVDVHGLQPLEQIGTEYIAKEIVGHAATWIDGTGYGYGPKDINANPVNTPGTTSGWESVPTPRLEIPVYLDNRNAVRRFANTGLPCKCNATKASVKACAEWYKSKWEGTTYSFPLHTCRDYVNAIQFGCCLSIYRNPPY